MTYLDQARAGDWGHEWPKPDPNAMVFPNCLMCGEKLLGDDNYYAACPVRIAKRVIEEIEALAKERCVLCSKTPELFEDGYYHRMGKIRYYCNAQPEQHRLAQLRAELANLPVVEREQADPH